MDRRHFFAASAAGLAAAALPELPAAETAWPTVPWDPHVDVPFPVRYEVTCQYTGGVLMAGTLVAHRRVDGSIIIEDAPEILTNRGNGTFASLSYEQRRMAGGDPPEDPRRASVA